MEIGTETGCEMWRIELDGKLSRVLSGGLPYVCGSYWR